MLQRTLSILISLHVLACPLWCALADASDHHHTSHTDGEGDHNENCSTEPCFCTASLIRPADRSVLPGTQQFFMDSRLDVNEDVLTPLPFLRFEIALLAIGPPPQHHLPLLI